MNPVKPGVYHDLDLLRLSRRTAQGERYDGFVGGVHHALYHVAFRQGLPPN